MLGSIPIYYMSMFKVPLQVLKRMEAIRGRFFNGVDVKEKRLMCVSWRNVLASKDKGGTWSVEFLCFESGSYV